MLNTLVNNTNNTTISVEVENPQKKENNSKCGLVSTLSNIVRRSPNAKRLSK